jgi:hypothetical protein
MYKWGLRTKGKLASKVWLRMITTSTWEQCELVWKFNQKRYNLEKASYCVEHVDSLDHSNPKQLGHLRLDNKLNAQRRLRINEQYSIKRIQHLESKFVDKFFKSIFWYFNWHLFDMHYLEHNVVLVLRPIVGS